MRTRHVLAVFVLGVMATMTSAAQTIWLDELDLAVMTADWGRPHANRSVENNPIRIAGRQFERGVGTHAESNWLIELDGKAERLEAWVGVDDEVGEDVGSVRFRLVGDGKELWKSDTLRTGDAAQQVNVKLAGVKQLVLQVLATGDGINYDHADWADARIVYTGAKPRAIAPEVEEPYILTPLPPRTPRINGARVFGVRPGNPILFRVPATGDRPMRFEADGMPAGVTLDPETGQLGGSVTRPGTYNITLRAINDLGEDTKPLRLVVGDRIALTPPMGWNSWNCFAHAVTDQNIRDAADALVETGLINHGWSYVNVDDYWQRQPPPGSPEYDEKYADGGGPRYPDLAGPARDDTGRIVPNHRFPDMVGLGKHIHERGLKFGIYSSPGPLTCGWCFGSYGHEAQDAETYAQWGVDYLKYDWCGYNKIVNINSNHLPDHTKPYKLMGEALRAQDRDIVYSLCQYGAASVSAWGDKVGGHAWRTTGDITDTWSSMSWIGFSQAGLELFAGPGNWNDPDMLVVGHVGWGPNLRPSRLTPNEQYTHISLWCLLSSPLLLGCDLTQLDAFTLSLLTNDEVIAVNQDPLGRQAARVAKDDTTQVWAKPMEDGSIAVGLFNLGEVPIKVAARWLDVGATGTHTVRDLWRQKDLGQFDGDFEATVPRHGVVLIRLIKAE